MGFFPYDELDRGILNKRPSEPTGGIAPEQRPTELILDYGIINLDKPAGPTSHQATAYVKQLLELPKCGHSGTLDPKVTGVLPVALNKASRIVQALLPAGKEYVGIMHLHKPVSKDTLMRVIEKFKGEIRQLPPVKSAVKRRVRKRKIYYLDILDIQEKDVLFRVGCQAGTYIRKLCHDIGRELNVGAHMQELRRTRVANFKEDTAVTLQDVADAYYYYKKEGNERFLRKIIVPVEKAVGHLPKVWVLDSAIPSLMHGQDLAVPGISKLEACVDKSALVAVMSLMNELIALGQALMSSDEIIKAQKGIAVNIHKVFIHHARVRYIK